MKRTLLAMAAMASTCSFAQSTVQAAPSTVSISGLLDLSVANVRTEAGGRKLHRTGLYSSGMSSNFLRFEGREDLGSGLYAMFRLESGLNIDTGLGIASNTNNQRSGAGAAASPMTYNRWAFVGLGSNALGELRAGRVYTAAFENFTPFDPFFTNGVGSSTPFSLRLGQRNTQTALNVSNALDYVTPGYGRGFFGRVTVALGENPRNGSLATSNPKHGGDHEAFRVGYAGGPLTIAFSAGLTHNTAGPTPTGLNAGDYLNTNLAVRYDLGWARLLGQYVTERLDGASAAGGNLTGIASNEARTRTLLVGASIPVGLGNIKLSFIDGKLSDNIGTRAEKGRLFALGYDYFFSKRTNVYVTGSYIDNNAVGNYSLATAYVTAGQGESSQGLSVGMRHLF